MKKLFSISVALILLFVFVSCCSTTYIDENKICCYEPGENDNSRIQLTDGTVYTQGTSESGDSYYTYYTKSQWEYDMFELGIVSSAEETEASIEFYYGDSETDTWNIAGTWNATSYEEFDNSSLPIIFIKPDNRNVSAQDEGQANLVSGKVYIKKWFEDYKVTFKFDSGEEISSYFKTQN